MNLCVPVIGNHEIHEHWSPTYNDLTVVLHVWPGFVDIPSVTVPQSIYSVQNSDPVTLTCVVSANPSATSVTWYRVTNSGLEPIVVGSSSKYSGGSVATPSLTLSSAVDSDQGTYRCTATNAAGTGSSANVVLNVEGSEWEVSLPKTFLFS